MDFNLFTKNWIQKVFPTPGGDMLVPNSISYKKVLSENIHKKIKPSCLPQGGLEITTQKVYSLWKSKFQ